MDGLFNKAKSMASSMGSGSGSNQGGAAQQGDVNNQAGNAGAAGNTGGEDYGDKGLDFLEKKSGHNMSRDQNEKITDGARGLYEKATGNTVDSKYSN